MSRARKRLAIGHPIGGKGIPAERSCRPPYGGITRIRFTPPASSGGPGSPAASGATLSRPARASRDAAEWAPPYDPESTALPRIARKPHGAARSKLKSSPGCLSPAQTRAGAGPGVGQALRLGIGPPRRPGAAASATLALHRRCGVDSASAARGPHRHAVRPAVRHAGRRDLARRARERRPLALRRLDRVPGDALPGEAARPRPPLRGRRGPLPGDHLPLGDRSAPTSCAAAGRRSPSGSSPIL